MTSLPIFFNGHPEFEEISYFGRIEKAEYIDIFDIDMHGTEIKGKYVLDYYSSVWIRNAVKYEKFAQLFEVMSGGWYGLERGGRWRTKKRTSGEISFMEIENYHKVTATDTDPNIFKIIKKRFYNKLIIEIQSRNEITYSFLCSKVKVSPSSRILLFDVTTEKFVDKTEILDSNGLGLLEDKFN